MRKILLIGLGVILLAGVPCQGAERLALLIGNSQYRTSPLNNPVHDVDLMQKVLKDLNFQVLRYDNLNLPQMESALREYRSKLTPGGLGLFFFSGHGLQLDGRNYLVPVNLASIDKHEVPFKLLDVGMVLGAMNESQANLNVLILDCCRNNPFQRSWNRSPRPGLAAIADVPQGTLIAYATAPGVTASDGLGGNSPYTSELARVLRQRPANGLELVDAFRDVGERVSRRVEQRPWLNFDTSMGRYYLWRESNARPTPDAIRPRIEEPVETVQVNSGFSMAGIWSLALSRWTRSDRGDVVIGARYGTDGSIRQVIMPDGRYSIQEYQTNRDEPAWVILERGRVSFRLNAARSADPAIAKEWPSYPSRGEMEKSVELPDGSTRTVLGIFRSNDMSFESHLNLSSSRRPATFSEALKRSGGGKIGMGRYLRVRTEGRHLEQAYAGLGGR